MNKRWLFLGLLLLLHAGCGPGETAKERGISAPQEPAAADTLSDIVGKEAPGRDPFARGEPVSFWERQTGQVDTGGRNPFAVPSAGYIDPKPEPGSDEPAFPRPQDPADGIPAGRVNVRLTLLDRCWLEVIVDGERVLRTNVASSTVLEYEAEREVALRQVGRDYAVEVIVNGNNLGRLSDFVPKMEDGVYEDRETGIRISLERGYTGGVLVGLRFRLPD